VLPRLSSGKDEQPEEGVELLGAHGAQREVARDPRLARARVGETSRNGTVRFQAQQIVRIEDVGPGQRRLGTEQTVADGYPEVERPTRRVERDAPLRPCHLTGLTVQPGDVLGDDRTGVGHAFRGGSGATLLSTTELPAPLPGRVF